MSANSVFSPAVSEQFKRSLRLNNGNKKLYAACHPELPLQPHIYGSFRVSDGFESPPLKVLAGTVKVWGSSVPPSAVKQRIVLAATQARGALGWRRSGVLGRDGVHVPRLTWLALQRVCSHQLKPMALSGRGGGATVAKLGQSEPSLKPAALDDEEERLNQRIRELMGSLEVSAGFNDSDTEEEEGGVDAFGKNSRRRRWQEVEEWDEGWGLSEVQRERSKGRRKGSSDRLNLSGIETKKPEPFGEVSSWRRSGTVTEQPWQDVSIGMELIWRKQPLVGVKRGKAEPLEDGGSALYETGQVGRQNDSRSELGKGNVVGNNLEQAGTEVDAVPCEETDSRLDSSLGSEPTETAQSSSIESSVDIFQASPEADLNRGRGREEEIGKMGTRLLKVQENGESAKPPDEKGVSSLKLDALTDGNNGNMKAFNVQRRLEARRGTLGRSLDPSITNGDVEQEKRIGNARLGQAELNGNMQSPTGVELAAVVAGPSSSARPAGAMSAGVPLLSNLNQPYQQLAINFDLALYRARKLLRKGRFKQAEEMLRECIRLWPADGRGYVALGKVMQSQGHMKGARRAYEEGCQAVGGDNAFLWQAWAVLEERLGNIARARKLFDAATAADKRHVAGWHGWAMLELREGNEAKARKLLKKGLRLCGASEYFYQTLGILEAKAGRVDEARALFRKATAACQWSVPSWLAWARVEAEQDEVAIARRLFQRALESSPKNRYVYQSWARFELEQGREGVARKLLRIGRQFNPRDTGLLLESALLAYESGFPGTARDIFREGTVIAPKFGPIWRAWGWMEWREGRLDAARKLYERAAKVEPSSPRAYQARGVLEDRAGNTAFARKFFKEALKVDPTNVPTWFSWADMEERLGNSVRAEELRSLCQQQRTEVVDNSWEFSDILAPAIDRVRSFFSFDSSPPARVSSDSESGDRLAEEVEAEEEDTVDIDKFLVEKIEPYLNRSADVSSTWKRTVSPDDLQKVREKSKRFNKRLRNYDRLERRVEGDEEKVSSRVQMEKALETSRDSEDENIG